MSKYSIIVQMYYCNNFAVFKETKHHAIFFILTLSSENSDETRITHMIEMDQIFYFPKNGLTL